MSDYEKESELIAYCGIYCRLCDYFTGKIRDSARNLLSVVRTHSELKLFANTAKAFDFENFVKGLNWLSDGFSPCVGGCRGGGGWGDCPLRKCCAEKSVRFCYKCGDFPCETLKHFPKRVEQLDELKREGLESWIKRKLAETE
jgi:hypothetical protein